MATNTRNGGDRYLIILDGKGDSATKKGAIEFLADSYIKYFQIPTGPGGRCFSTRGKDIKNGTFRSLAPNVLGNCGFADKLYICGHGNKKECGDHDSTSLPKLLSGAGLKKIGLVTFKSCCIGQDGFLDVFVANCGNNAIQLGYAKGYKDSLYANLSPNSLKPISVIGRIKGKSQAQIDDSRRKTNTARYKIIVGPLADEVQWDNRFLSEIQLLEKDRLKREKAVREFEPKSLKSFHEDSLILEGLEQTYDFGMKTVQETI